MQLRQVFADPVTFIKKYGLFLRILCINGLVTSFTLLFACPTNCNVQRKKLKSDRDK